MSNAIGKVYATFLKKKEVDSTLQRHIYTYGNRSGDLNLLASLLTVSNLEPSLDQLLKEHPSAVVKAAWAGRPGRTIVEIENLVAKEKRIKVLTALAEREDTPAEVFKVIAEKSKGLGSLVALILNQVVDKSVKEKALLGLLSITNEGDINGVKIEDSNKVPFKEIISMNPELIELMALNTKSINLISELVQSDYLSPEVQKHILELVKKSIPIITNKPRGHYDNLSLYHFNYINSIVSNMCEQGSMEESVGKEFTKILEKLIKDHKETKNNWYSNNFESAIEEIKNTKSNPVINYKEAIGKVSSTEELDKLIHDLLEVGKSQRRNSRLAAGTIAAITSRYATPEQIFYLVSEDEQVSWWEYRGIIKVLNSPEKIASIIARYSYLGVDDAFKHLNNPEAGILAMVKLVSSKGLHISEDLLNSKYLTEDVAKHLPLRVLSNENLPLMVSDLLSNVIKDNLLSEEAWLTFETLGEEFEGSILELLNLVNSI